MSTNQYILILLNNLHNSSLNLNSQVATWSKCITNVLPKTWRSIHISVPYLLLHLGSATVGACKILVCESICCIIYIYIIVMCRLHGYRYNLQETTTVTVLQVLVECNFYLVQVHSMYIFQLNAMHHLQSQTLFLLRVCNRIHYYTMLDYLCYAESRPTRTWSI